MLYLISVIIFAIFCVIMLGVFYVIIKIQEKKFKQYLNEKTLETINTINRTTQNMIGIALEVADSELRGKYDKSKWRY